MYAKIIHYFYIHSIRMRKGLRFNIFLYVCGLYKAVDNDVE